MVSTKFAGVRGMPAQFAFRSVSQGSTGKTRQTSRIRELGAALARISHTIFARSSMFARRFVWFSADALPCGVGRRESCWDFPGTKTWSRWAWG